MGLLQDFSPAAVASGMMFGSAATLAGVASPQIIVNQLRLTDFHMLLTFMTASACSAVIVAASKSFGYVDLGHRKDSTYGWLGKYEGNVIGGALQGMGMALTGACSGTVLVQAAAGVERSLLVMLGGVLGGIVFVRWREGVKGVDEDPKAKYTVMQKTGLSTSATVLGYEVLILSTILAANTLAPRGRYWLNPVVGGTLIGAAQATSVLFSKKTLGVSSAYEEAGKWVWAVVRGSKRPVFGNLTFAAGVMLGARIAMAYVPATREAVWSEYGISTFTAVAGGFAIIFGGRLAGGCTSGHGISGMATMSVSSFITVASMFSAGIATALVKG